MNTYDDIRIGALVPVDDRTTEVIRHLFLRGFETFQSRSCGTRTGGRSA